MRPLPHEYLAQLSGTSVGYAEVSSAGLPVLRLAAPLDYDGPGDAWSPEHLLLASLQGCLLLTFRALARLSQLPFVSLEMDTTGIVNKQDGVTRFTEIVLRPVLTVPPGTDHARARRVLERSEKACLISASLSTALRMESRVRDADTASDARADEGREGPRV
ncbi:MAG: OsmC family protein [Dehalococcoidia bacterium]